MLLHGKTFKIRKFNNKHRCSRPDSNREVTSIWIAEKFEEAIRMDPEYKINVLEQELKRKYGVKCEKQKLYRAKKRVLDKINGDHGVCYGLLYKYGNILIQRNEGTVALIKAERPSISVNPIFQRFFFVFSSSEDRIFGRL